VCHGLFRTCSIAVCKSHSETQNRGCDSARLCYTVVTPQTARADPQEEKDDRIMRKKRIAADGPAVSVIGFGCWAIGGRHWGEVDDGDSREAILRALELGIDFFDTADVYGLGHSEEILGETLGPRRRSVFIATKVGGRWDEKGNVRVDGSREYILRAVDDSLRRLRTDYVDLYQLHTPDPERPIGESVEALAETVKLGKARYIGLSNVSVAQLERALTVAPIQTVQPEYSMLKRTEEKRLLPLCREKGIGILAYSPMARGLLTGKFGPQTTFPPDDIRAVDPAFQGELFSIHLAAVEKIKKVARSIDATSAQLALAWVLSNPAVSVALAGTKKPHQIEETAKAADLRLTESVMGELDAILSETEKRKSDYTRSQIEMIRTHDLSNLTDPVRIASFRTALVSWMLQLEERGGGPSEQLETYFNALMQSRRKSIEQQARQLEKTRNALIAYENSMEDQ